MPQTQRALYPPSFQSYSHILTPRTSSPSSRHIASCTKTPTTYTPHSATTSLTSTPSLRPTPAKTPTAPVTAKRCPPTDPSTYQMNHQPPPRTATLIVKKPHCPSKAWNLRPLSSAPHSKKRPNNTPQYPLEQPPGSSTWSGMTTPLATTPYLPKRPRTCSLKTMTLAQPSTPWPMASSPPSTAALPSSPSSYENPSNAFGTKGSLWPSTTKKLSTSMPEPGTSWPWPASYPTRGASTVSSLQRTGPLWSHILYNAEGVGKSKWWQEGHLGSQSTSPTYTLLPITHAS